MPKKGKPTGPWIPNPDCARCSDIACIDCYMAAGGYND